MTLTGIDADVAAAVPVPQWSHSVLAIAPPGDGEGHWAGAPSALLADDGTIYLAYRLRRPVGEGRGYATMVARSDDGIHFENIATIGRDAFDCDSLERPALVRLDDGGWRVYVSCATAGTLHWHVDAIDADTPELFDAASRKTVFEGDDATAYKDPVVMRLDGGWHAWVCVHHIESPVDADRMSTVYATSRDGIEWTVHGRALEGRSDKWDARGARVSSVLPPGVTGGAYVAYYDGRRTFEENWHERTGIAVGTGPERFNAAGNQPVAASPNRDGALRYVSIVCLPDGAFRFYYEATRPDGSHDLRTEYVSPTR